MIPDFPQSVPLCIFVKTRRQTRPCATVWSRHRKPAADRLLSLSTGKFKKKFLPSLFLSFFKKISLFRDACTMYKNTFLVKRPVSMARSE